MNNVLLVAGVGSVDTLTAASHSFLAVNLTSYHYPPSGTFLLGPEGGGGVGGGKYDCVCTYSEASDTNHSILHLGAWLKWFLALGYGIFGWGCGPPELRQELAAWDNTLHLGQVSTVSTHLGLTEGHVLGGVLRGAFSPGEGWDGWCCSQSVPASLGGELVGSLGALETGQGWDIGSVLFTTLRGWGVVGSPTVHLILHIFPCISTDAFLNGLWILLKATEKFLVFVLHALLRFELIELYVLNVHARVYCFPAKQWRSWADGEFACKETA